MSAARSTLVDLHRAIKARMVEIAAGLPLFETKTTARAPSVPDGWLAPKDGPTAERFPFIIVRPRTGVDSAAGADADARATFEILIGTYSDTNDGFLDVLIVVDRIRQSLGAAPRLDDTAFEHVGPLSWELFEEQPRPQWEGRAVLTFQIPRPVREPEIA